MRESGFATPCFTCQGKCFSFGNLKRHIPNGTDGCGGRGIRDRKISYFKKRAKRQIYSSRLSVRAVSGVRTHCIRLFGEVAGDMLFDACTRSAAISVQLISHETSLTFKLLLDSKQLIIFTNAIGTAGGSGLDLACVCSYCQIRNK